MKLQKDHIIIIAVLAVLCLLEVSIRFFENNLSGNLNHINEIPGILAQYVQDDKPTILFLGNSLINESVDIAQLDQLLGGKYHVNKITPDGTSIWDWSRILENQVLKKQANHIDYLVVGFAWGLLSDRYHPNPSRLGGYFAKIEDYPQLYKDGMQSFADFSEFVLGRGSKLFVNREAVRNKVMIQLIPYYERFVREANQAAGKPEDTQQKTKDTNGVKHQYLILSRIFQRLKDNGTKVIVVAMPIEQPYEVDPPLVSALNEATVEYLDYRDFFVEKNGVYKDGVHLNALGRDHFTSNLGRLFNQKVSSD
jgi:hypothetical protein